MGESRVEELSLHERRGSPGGFKQVTWVRGCRTTTRATVHEPLTFFSCIIDQEPNHPLFWTVRVLQLHRGGFTFAGHGVARRPNLHLNYQGGIPVLTEGRASQTKPKLFHQIW